jgi:hypothetical protein
VSPLGRFADSAAGRVLCVLLAVALALAIGFLAVLAGRGLAQALVRLLP